MRRFLSSVASCSQKSQQRPTNIAKETYWHSKRDLNAMPKGLNTMRRFSPQRHACSQKSSIEWSGFIQYLYYKQFHSNKKTRQNTVAFYSNYTLGHWRWRILCMTLEIFVYNYYRKPLYCIFYSVIIHWDTDVGEFYCVLRWRILLCPCVQRTDKILQTSIVIIY